jgi:hypothetical protein
MKSPLQRHNKIFLHTRQLYYMVVVMSNVLRKNSVVVHQTPATRLQRMLEADHGVGKFSSNAPQADK